MSREENLAKMLEWSKAPPAEYREDDFVEGCTGKNRHPSVAAAERAAEIIGDDNLVAYNCKNCGGWHAGHRPVKRRRIKLRR